MVSLLLVKYDLNEGRQAASLKLPAKGTRSNLHEPTVITALLGVPAVLVSGVVRSRMAARIDTGEKKSPKRTVAVSTFSRTRRHRLWYYADHKQLPFALDRSGSTIGDRKILWTRDEFPQVACAHVTRVAATIGVFQDVRSRSVRKVQASE